MRMFLSFLIPIAIFLTVDWYAYQAVRTSVAGWSARSKLSVSVFYWGFTLFFIGSMFMFRFWGYKNLSREVNTFMTGLFVAVLSAKVILILFMLGEDVARAGRLVVQHFSTPQSGTKISRSAFLSKLAMGVAAVPAAGLIYGIVANRYNYRIHRATIKLPQLPAAFDGFRIVQLSDIHAGSFTDTEPLMKAVATINALRADLVLFTGDLVNNVADEMNDYVPVFKKIEARHGVMSVTGNHDYGDYVPWNSREEKVTNFKNFLNVHRQLGWDLLMNESRIIEKDGEKIAILGVENWGKGRFAKYGKLDAAYTGTETVATKILMSHDPSHWDEVVRKQYPDIALTLSGHTHGFQMGIENKWLKWSPSQYIYRQWAGLYREGGQLLYVNRGFGFLGYPGRLGILPEITEITLRKA